VPALEIGAYRLVEEPIPSCRRQVSRLFRADVTVHVPLDNPIENRLAIEFTIISK